MRIGGETKLFGLLGDPIAHSLSPAIHNAAFEKLGENAAYLPFRIAGEDLEAFVRLFPRIGGIGLNVTTPHKAAVGRIVRPGEDEVVQTGIVNTIAYREGAAMGFATDGRGFRSWMRARNIRPGPGGVVLMGFGATGRSLAWQLGREFPLTIVTRSPHESEAVLQGWYGKGWPGLPARVLTWADASPGQAFLAVGGLPGDFARSKDVAGWLAGLDPAGVVVDLNYGHGRTPLRDQARDRGLTAHDGLGLLVHQAALSLSLWLSSEVPASILEEGLPAARP